MSASPGLAGSAEPLATRFDVALLDLDGVAYTGREPIPGAARAIAAAVQAGMRRAFVTNNASRTPETIAGHLRELGVDAEPDDIVTSAQASARLLADRLGAGAAVLVVGTEALCSIVAEAGLRPVRRADEDPVAVVQGYDPDIGYAALAEATLAVRGGALWVATNADTTMPSPRGLLPGNGALVAAVRAATGARPLVAGKPELPLHREAVRRTGAQRPLVVGDRLDTDIEGAVRAGTPSLLVLTGVTDAAALLAAEPCARPSYVAPDLTGLLRPHPEVKVETWGARCGSWCARLDGARLDLRRDATAAGTQDEDDDGCDPLRALCAAAWAAHDAGVDRVRVGGDPDAVAALGLHEE